MTAFPSCQFAGRQRQVAGDRFCRLNGTPTVVAPSFCWRCQHAGTEGQQKPPDGVGDVFGQILMERHGASADAHLPCNCAAVKHEMNANGPDWCEEHADELARKVVENLNQSAHWQRHLPEFIKTTYLRRLILEAIKAVREWTPAG